MRAADEPLSAAQRNELLERARAVAQRAYAPYSRFRVGAAVLAESGIYVGTNVENASSGLSLCAERSALSAAIAAGDINLRAIALACIDADRSALPGSLMPCGACRQWMAELAPHATVLIAGLDREYTIADLLPEPFQLP